MPVDPDDCLGKVQSRGFPHGRVVGAVGVPAPDVERPSGFGQAGNVAGPSAEKRIELFVGDEVVRQGAVVRPHLSVRSAGVFGMRLAIEALRLLRALERTQPRGDRIV